MNPTFRSLLAASALLAGLSVQAARADEPVSYPRPASYPQMVGTGENQDVEYGPGPHGNIVGGGAVLTHTDGNGDLHITYLDDSKVQKGLPGLEPVLVQQGQNSSVVYLPRTVSPRG